MPLANETGPTIGWVGTGRMGAVLVERLAVAGLDVIAWNRTRRKAEALAKVGVKVADELAQLADCHVVFTSLAASADVEEIVLGQLLADPTRTPRVIADCSTISVESSANVRAAAAERGSAFLACPVSGNPKVAAAGMLSLICSGPRAAFDETSPVLRLLGRHVTYVGDADQARLVKICHNVFLGVVAQSLAEVTVLAEKGGVSRAAFLDVINNSVMGSVFSRYKTPAYVHLDYTPAFTPVLLRKDMDLGDSAAAALGVPMPVAAAARECVRTAVARGYTEEDFAILLDLQARASGLELTAETTPVDDGLHL